MPPQDLASRVTGPVLNLPLDVNDGYAMFLQLFHRQPIATGYLARGSREREEHFIRLRRLLDKGGAALCDGLAEMGIKTIILASESYMIRVAADMEPLNLVNAHLNIVDLRGRVRFTTVEMDTLPTSGWEALRIPAFREERQLIQHDECESFLCYGWSALSLFTWSIKERRLLSLLEGTGDSWFVLRCRPSSQPEMERQRVNISLTGN